MGVLSLRGRIKESSDFLRGEGFAGSAVGIILGTGLNGFVERLEGRAALAYGSIPHFPSPTTGLHKGLLHRGTVHGREVVVMQGRMHLYEGFTPWEVTYPVRVLEELGAKSLLVSNASGNMNLSWSKGDLMLVTDHIDFTGSSPLRGLDPSEFGSLFVDMSNPYDSDIRSRLIRAASELGITLRQGVYVGVVGPNLETRSEYRFLRASGADVVGMSTVPEVIVANHSGLPVGVVSVLTDNCDPENLAPVVVEEIMETAARADATLCKLFSGYIGSL